MTLQLKWIVVSLVSLTISATAGAQSHAIPSTNSDTLQQEMAKQKEANKKMAAQTQWVYFVVKTDGGSYGYDIYADGRQYIHQPTIPGRVGNKGFLDTASAGKTARLVIQKIKEGESPPTITEADLKKLKVVE